MLSTVISVIGLLLCGSFAGFLRKVLFQIVGAGLNFEHHPFEKPWFTTVQTTLGCALALCTHQITTRLFDRRWRKTPSGASDLEAMDDAATTTAAGDGGLYQPLLPGHEESRRRLTAAGKDGLRSKAGVQQFGKVGQSGGGGHGRRVGEVQHEEVGSGVVTWAKLQKLVMPAVLYQLGVITQGIGLRYTSASVNQMISGSCIIFTAIFSVIFLHRHLNWNHWTGLLVACMGVAVVSMASLQMAGPEAEIDDESGKLILPQPSQQSAQEISYGIAMTILSQVLGAAQMVWEEAYLSDLRLGPLQVMGWEGVLGLAMDLVLFMPLAALLPGPDVGGIEENTLDTILMLARSHTLRVISLAFLVTVAGTSQFGIIVSSRLGSVFRALLLTARTVLIWVMDLVVFYGGIGPNTLGEGWSRSSPTRAVGFALLLAGTGLYCYECLVVKRPAAPASKRNGRDKESPPASAARPGHTATAARGDPDSPLFV